MNHQDWNPVTISKPVVPVKGNTVTYTTPKLKYDEDDQEIIKLNVMKDKQTYVQMRDTLKLTRAQVAQMLSVRVNMINAIENGDIMDKSVATRYKLLLKNKIKKMNTESVDEA